MHKLYMHHGVALRGYSISEEMSSNLTRFLNLFDNFFSGLTRIRTHAQVVHASWCCLARHIYIYIYIYAEAIYIFYVGRESSMGL